ncbi:MAG: hypothetical protein WC646_00010 [Candidatus Paceibacterota bacterium]|jgi:hypothetical protein
MLEKGNRGGKKLVAGVDYGSSGEKDYSRAAELLPELPREDTGEEWYTSFNQTSVGKRTEVRVKITNKTPITGKLEESRGAFGKVYSVNVEVPGMEGPAPRFALKEYRNEELALSSHQNYVRGRDSGLKVWRTYRLGADGKSVLMSTSNSQEWRVMGDRNTLSAEEVKVFLPIENFEGFLNAYYEQAVKAAEKHIAIGGDVPMFLVNKNKLDFILGDMDQLDKSDSEPQELLPQNLQGMHSRLVVFLEENCPDHDIESYIAESAGHIKKVFGVSVSRYMGGEEF